MSGMFLSSHSLSCLLQAWCLTFVQLPCRSLSSYVLTVTMPSLADIFGIFLNTQGVPLTLLHTAQHWETLIESEGPVEANELATILTIVKWNNCNHPEKYLSLLPRFVSQSTYIKKYKTLWNIKKSLRKIEIRRALTLFQ